MSRRVKNGVSDKWEFFFFCLLLAKWDAFLYLCKYSIIFAYIEDSLGVVLMRLWLLADEMIF